MNKNIFALLYHHINPLPPKQTCIPIIPYTTAVSLIWSKQEKIFQNKILCYTSI